MSYNELQWVTIKLIETHKILFWGDWGYCVNWVYWVYWVYWGLYPYSL